MPDEACLPEERSSWLAPPKCAYSGVRDTCAFVCFLRGVFQTPVFSSHRSIFKLNVRDFHTGHRDVKVH